MLPKSKAPLTLTLSPETNIFKWPKKFVKEIDQIASGAENVYIKKYL